MKIERVYVYGWQASLRGMRNPKESWDKSDSCYYPKIIPDDRFPGIVVPECPLIGFNDMKLACSLIKAGSDHRKFLRQIMVWWDITIPRAIWQELP